MKRILSKRTGESARPRQLAISWAQGIPGVGAVNEAQVEIEGYGIASAVRIVVDPDELVRAVTDEFGIFAIRESDLPEVEISKTDDRDVVIGGDTYTAVGRSVDEVELGLLRMAALVKHLHGVMREEAEEAERRAKVEVLQEIANGSSQGMRLPSKLVAAVLADPRVQVTP